MCKLLAATFPSPDPSQGGGIVETTHVNCGGVRGGLVPHELRAEGDVPDGAGLRHDKEEGALGHDAAHDHHHGDNDGRENLEKRREWRGINTKSVFYQGTSFGRS